MPFAQKHADGGTVIRDQRFGNRAIRANFEVIVPAAD
jgi:hypothetical protein